MISLGRFYGLVPGLMLVLVAPAPGATNQLSWKSRAWRSDDGLPNNTVYGIVQTPDHYLWIGTANGLARFDGLHFEDFSSTNFIQPPDRGVLALAGTADGGLRLVTDRASLVWLDAGQSRVFPAERGLPSSAVTQILEDAQRGLWVSYNNGEVCRIKAGQLKVFSEADGLPDGPLCCSLAMDTKGRLWFLKNGRLGFFREEAFQTMVKVPPGPGRLTPSRKGGVWFSSGGRLFYCDEAGTVQSQGEFALGRDAATTASVLLEAQDGAVWVGTAFQGLYRCFAEQQFEQVPTTHREILSLLEDVEGTIWAGTGGGGLNRIRPQAIELLTGEPGSPLDSVSSIAQETNGVVWAVTRDGSLSRLKEGRWQALPRSTNWFADALSVAVDARGVVWVGTRHHGLLCWQHEQFVSWGDTSQIKTDSIHTIVPGRNGDIWLGGGEIPAAVMRLRGGGILNYRVPNDVRVIRTSVEDAAGNIWFGTSKGFLLRAEGERLIDETPRTTGEPQSIRCLYATPDGGLWIGYAGAGLGWLKDNKFTLFTAKQGLQDDFVSQIVADGRGWLWLGADRGIYRVRQAELEAVAKGKAARLHSTHYGPGYGLPSLQANFGSAPLGLRSLDNRIWLAMWTALAVIDPQRLPETTPSPPVLLTRMMVGERIVAAYGGVWPLSTSGPEVLDLSRPLDREVKLAPDHRRLEFGFAALNFADAENVSFRYRLEGVDEDWVDTERRNVTYPRLPKGHYRFRVSACSPEGAWSDKEASVMFQVEPFFWETWWFRLLVPTLFTAFVIALVRYVSFRRLRSQVIHLEQQSALYRERARIAQDIHDDLGASLTQISFMGELARQDSATPEKVTVHIETMAGTARRAVKALDEIVWAVNPRNDTLVQFIDYTAQFSLDYLRRAGVRCRLDLPEQVPDGQLSSDIRHNLFLVVKEAINNTVKYAHATELRLRIALDESKLELLIEDNGCGFAQVKDDTNADGLRNIRQRVADLGGECRIEGDPGKGTRIAVELPRPRDVKR